MSLINLFPVGVYVDENKNLIHETNLLFETYKEFFIDNGVDFKTTLKDYNPLNAVLTIDLLTCNSTDNLKKYIVDSTKKYLECQGYHNYDIKIINLWLNEMTSGQCHTPHHHYGYTFSGSYFCSCPENSNILEVYNPGKFQFSHKLTKIKELTSYNSNSCLLDINEGNIILFPSYIRHAVPQCNFIGVRRSIAFDIIVV